MSNILYPYILECCLHTKDPIWIDLFIKLSRGICPRGSHIENNMIRVGKNVVYELVRKDSFVLYTDLIKLFKVHSTDDFKAYIDVCEKYEDCIVRIKEQNKDQKILKKKKNKFIHVENYILSLQQKYNLSRLQVKTILSKIQIAFMMKIITNKDIEFKNGRIISIRGVAENTGNIQIKKGTIKYSAKKKSNAQPNRINMMEKWEKYWKLTAHKYNIKS